MNRKFGILWKAVSYTHLDVYKRQTLIPLFVMFTNLGLLDSYVGLILPYTVFSFGQSIYIMRGFFGNLPKEMEEAAVIDGCSIWGAYWRIILPISTAGIFTIGLFTFNGTWNELLVALVFTTGESVRTLPPGLTAFVGQYSTNYCLLYTSRCV